LPTYEVYATRWDDPRTVEEPIPATDLTFTMPLSDHGACSFNASVEPGRSYWRAALAADVSGCVVTCDDTPVWSGMMTGETQSGPRTFGFTFTEWGSFFEQVPAVPAWYASTNDHAIFRDLIARVQADPYTDPKITMSGTLGASTSELRINSWDSTTVAEEFRRLAESASGPEWYFETTGRLDYPRRALILGDRLGVTEPVVTLEYVEDTVEVTETGSSPTITSLGTLFPGRQPYAVVGGRRGGNVISHPARKQNMGYSQAIAVGGGQDVSQIRATVRSDTLLKSGHPLRTKVTQYNDVVRLLTITRHAEADLQAVAGMTTSYSMSTFEDDPDWRTVARGDTVRVELDTDVYGEERPYVFDTRVLEIAVAVQSNGPAQVNYTLASVQEF
jgi:hypothetical protein